MVFGTGIEALDAVFAQHVNASSASLPGHSIECQTTGADLTFHGQLAKVICPPHCERDPHGVVLGASLHPLGSTVCGAALVDGVLSPEVSGELLVTRVPGIPSYVGADVRASSSLSVADARGDAFHVYATDSVDHAQGDVRLLDRSGAASARGLLQVLTDADFGTVCGANFGAAEVICRQLGYEHGTLSTSKCGDLPAGNLCGASGTPVAMKNLQCLGEEGSLQESTCSWEPPDDQCLAHEDDAIISCFDKGPHDSVPEGELRLVAPDGGPVQDGLGRLEIFHDSKWGPVCGEGFTPGNVFVACRSLGYDGADLSALPNDSRLTQAENESGRGDEAVLSDLHCTGSENSILDCPHSEGEEASCYSGRSALIRCVGNGLPNSAGLGKAVPPPILEPAAFAPKRTLGCSDTLDSLGMAQAPPGTSIVVGCTGDCENSCRVAGRSIYSSDSSICCAARHAGIIGAAGGDAMVTVGHGQASYFGAAAHGIQSQDLAGSRSNRSFLVATPTTEVLSRIAPRPLRWQRYAGRSALGGMTSVTEFL